MGTKPAANLMINSPILQQAEKCLAQQQQVLTALTDGFENWMKRAPNHPKFSILVQLSDALVVSNKKFKDLLDEFADNQINGGIPLAAPPAAPEPPKPKKEKEKAAKPKPEATPLLAPIVEEEDEEEDEEDADLEEDLDDNDGQESIEEEEEGEESAPEEQEE